MQTILNSLVERCVENGYVSEQDAPCLKYAIEKRFTGILVAIPFLALGFSISNMSLTLAYFIGFRFLRNRTNGFHAKTVVGCLIASMACELFFLGVLQNLRYDSTCMLLVVAAIIIYILAPYRHPNMELSEQEISACAKSAKIRLAILLTVIVLMGSLSLYHLANGLALSVVTTAAMLVLAYIFRKGGNDNGNTEKQEETIPR